MSASAVAVREPTPAHQKIARITGWLFIVTFVTSIPAALFLYTPVLDNARYIVGGGADTRVFWGALLEMILIVANIGSAVVLFPILKRQSEGLALSYVTARIVESAFILVAIHDWTFLLGPGFIVGIGNGLLLGYLMYRSGLVPRRMAMLGLIGGPLIILSGIGVLFGLFDAGSSPQVIATIPEFFWELSLGIYLVVKGFKPSPILTAEVAAEPVVRVDIPDPAPVAV
jgi:hypothetical protein